MKKVTFLLLFVISMGSQAAGVKEKASEGLETAAQNYQASCSYRYRYALETLGGIVIAYTEHLINPREMRLRVAALRGQIYSLSGVCFFNPTTREEDRRLREQKAVYERFHKEVIKGYKEGRGDLYFIGLTAKYQIRSLFY